MPQNPAEPCCWKCWKMVRKKKKTVSHRCYFLINRSEPADVVRRLKKSFDCFCRKVSLSFTYSLWLDIKCSRIHNDKWTSALKCNSGAHTHTHTHTHTQCYWCAAFRAAYLLHKNGPVLLGSGLVIGEERRASPRRSELCATLRHVCHYESWIKTPADSFFLYIRTVCDSSASVKPHPKHSLLDNEALALLCLWRAFAENMNKWKAEAEQEAEFIYLQCAVVASHDFTDTQFCCNPT